MLEEYRFKKLAKFLTFYDVVEEAGRKAERDNKTVRF